MDLAPESFAARVQALLAAPGAEHVSLTRSVETAAALVGETAALASPAPR
jgi:hypothetical protein